MPTQAMLDYASRIREAIEQRQKYDAEHWLESRYKATLYGGWRHPDGRWIDKAHEPAIEEHETVKALYCPACNHCHEVVCECEPVSTCRRLIGFAGTDESEVFTCPEHGDFTLRQCWTYPTVILSWGNRTGKDYSARAEFSAWIRGYRPWDGTLTAPKGHGRYWIITAERYTSAETIVIPYFEEANADIILDRIKGNAGQLKEWLVRSSDGGVDHVVLRTNQQYLRAPSGDNPFEGSTWYGALESEPLARGARVAVKRGLITSMAMGWGRELIAATPLFNNYMADLIERADEPGESKGSSLIVLTAHMDQNPSLRKQDIETYMEELDPEEREARRYGRPMRRAGRILKAYDDAVHMVEGDFGTIGDSPAPNDWPAFCVIDPHDSKAHCVVWGLIAPNDTYYVLWEWPANLNLRNAGAMDFERAADVIRAFEEQHIPGGSERVLYRVMDPDFGSQTKAGLLGTVQEEFEEEGLFFDIDVSNDINAGHGRLRKLLDWDHEKAMDRKNRPHLFVHERCQGVRNALKKYAYKEKIKADGSIEEVIDEKYKDPIDCLRYIVMMRPEFQPWQGGVSAAIDEQTAWLEAEVARDMEGWA